MIDPDFEKEFKFDINQYLCDKYPTMNLATRVDICRLCLNVFLDDEPMHEPVDEVVAYYALDKLNLLKEYDEFNEDEVDEETESE